MAFAPSNSAYQAARRQGRCASGRSQSCAGLPNLSNMANWRFAPAGFDRERAPPSAICKNCGRYAKADAAKRAQELAAKRLHNSPHPLRTRRDRKSTPARPPAPRRRSEMDRLHSGYRFDNGRSSEPPNYDKRPAFPTSARRGPVQPMETTMTPLTVAGRLARGRRHPRVVRPRPTDPLLARAGKRNQ